MAGVQADSSYIYYLNFVGIDGNSMNVKFYDMFHDSVLIYTASSLTSYPELDNGGSSDKQ